MWEKMKKKYFRICWTQTPGLKIVYTTSQEFIKSISDCDRLWLPPWNYISGEKSVEVMLLHVIFEIIRLWDAVCPVTELEKNIEGGRQGATNFRKGPKTHYSNV